MDLNDLDEILTIATKYYGRRPTRIWFGIDLYNDFYAAMPGADRKTVIGYEGPHFIFDGVVVSHCRTLTPGGFLCPDAFREFDPPDLVMPI